MFDVRLPSQYLSTARSLRRRVRPPVSFEEAAKMMASAQPHFATRLNSFALGGGVAHPTKKPPTLDLVEIAGSVAGLTALEVNYPEHFVDTRPAELSSAINDAGLVNTGIQVRWPASQFSDGGFTHHSAEVRAA